MTNDDAAAAMMMMLVSPGPGEVHRLAVSGRMQSSAERSQHVQEPFLNTTPVVT